VGDPNGLIAELGVLVFLSGSGENISSRWEYVLFKEQLWFIKHLTGSEMILEGSYYERPKT
jgi:hypothetical protein